MEWAPGRKVTALLAMPGDAISPPVLLAPGAGAGQGSGFVTGLRRRMSAAGSAAMTFDYPYQEEGRRRPDRPATLEACHRAAANRLAGYGAPVVLAGKSMGGRIGSHIAAETNCAALVFFGYPFLPPGRPQPRSVEHLERLDIPMLFVNGTRDRLAPIEIVTDALSRLPTAEAAIIEGGDHSFRLPAATGIGMERVLDDLAAVTMAWLRDLPGG